MRKLIVPTLAILSFLVAPMAAGSQAAAQESPETAQWRTQHSMLLGGQRIEYDAVVGSVILRRDHEEPTGELFYTAYFRTGVPDAVSRPIVFAYNGGPGSASFWLHMGIMGPKRVVTPTVGPQGAPPYPLVDNQYTLLDLADIVMIDPIGTGFSRPLGDTPGTVFWGIDEDARSLTQFIRTFLSQYRRWNSPRYLLGESYGTTRSAVLAGHLQGANMDLNGIVLVSSVLDFQTIQFPPQAIVAYVVNLPSYALVAAYHQALPGGAPEDLQVFLAEVEAWAVGEYAHALLAGSALDPSLRDRVIRRMHQYTGLSPDYLDRANLRVTSPEFRQELLRSRSLQVGRLDARFTGPIGQPLDRTPTHDVQSTAISSAYTSLFNAYLREELGYDGVREYTPSGAARPWNWSRQGGGGRGDTPNVAPDLARAILRNPELEVLLVNGVYDLATPYFAAVWTMDQLGLPPELRDNIQRADFAAGHMMYVEEDLLPQWREVLSAFIRRTSR
jgi:carboxypeptidase C (cathepsin A)